MKLELQYISYDKCPECGARWVTAGVERGVDGPVRKHIMGGEWEYIEFECERRDEYIPNFEAIKTRKLCSHNPKMIAEATRKATAKKAVTDALAKVKLNEKEREDFDRQIHCTFDY